MALESGTYINALDPNNPEDGDKFKFGDDHLRLLKSTIKATFPNLTGPMTATQAQLNSAVEIAPRVDGYDGTSALKAVTPENGKTYWLRYHTTEGDGGGGWFRGAAGAAPGTYTDDNGITFLPSSGNGSAAFIREYIGPVDPRWFGAVIGAGSDSTTAFNAAIATGEDVEYTGTYLVGNLTGFVRGQGFKQNAVFTSYLVPNVVDGSYIIDIDNIDDLDLDVHIYYSGHGGVPASGAKNCGGVRTTSSCSRGRFKIRVEGCVNSVDLDGWLNDVFVDAQYCQNGPILSNQNGSEISLNIESCNDPLDLTESNAINIKRMDIEGTQISTSGTIDNCKGVTIAGLYLEETSATVPVLSIGATTLVENLNMPGISVSGLDDSTIVAAIALDNVDGVFVDGHFASGTSRSTITWTANTRDLRFGRIHGDFARPHDYNATLRPVQNLWPNPEFELWFRGWDAITTTSATISQETTLVRSGAQSMKITCTASATTSDVRLELNNTYSGLPTLLRGKNVLIGVWMWVPVIAAYNPLSQTMYPRVRAFSYNGSVQVNSTEYNTNLSTGNHNTGAWNFYCVSLAVQTDATFVTVVCEANIGGAAAAGSEYVVVDSIRMIEDDGTNYMRLLSGEVSEHPLNPVSQLGGRMIMRAAADPVDTDLVYVIGDRVEYITPTAGGQLGEVCTTGGAGGTAVFKTYGAITA